MCSWGPVWGGDLGDKTGVSDKNQVIDLYTTLKLKMINETARPRSRIIFLLRTLPRI